MCRSTLESDGPIRGQSVSAPLSAANVVPRTPVHPFVTESHNLPKPLPDSANHLPERRAAQVWRHATNRLGRNHRRQDMTRPAPE